ncbi:sensor histidine kinase [Flavobacterium akiainvivens]|uniref:sensor histidine kinase n=1 Tax=Flavobacterium akiainvivens TaxID=1202724 RepID=UPI001364C2F2|nr:ATP-binding protein [Flavobacterium akiainvivens]
MSPITAATFIISGIGLLFIHDGIKPIYMQCTFHAVTLITSVALIGHLLHVPEFYHMSFTPMSVYSAVALFLFSIASSLLNPTKGLTGIFTGDRIGNLMARRLFISMLIAVSVVCYLRLHFYRKGIIGVELGLALLLLTFCLTSLVLITIVARTLNKANAKANRATNNFRYIVQASPYAILMTDKNGLIQEVNHEAEKVFGYTKHELLGKSVGILVPGISRDAWMERRTALFADPQTRQVGFHDEIISVKKDGTEFPIEITLTPLNLSRDTYSILSFIKDITQRRANEELIKTQLTELQHKNEELEQFNYISSHDLQEPLRTVSNYIMLLEEDYPYVIRGEIKEHLQSINNAVNRMRTLVRSLLDFGKLGQNRKMSAVDTHEVTNHVVEDLQGLIKENNATVLIEGTLPKLYAYALELRQLLQNLVNNAIKFKSKERPPVVSISATSIEGYYQFKVADNGIGIAPEHREKIFNIFQKLHAEEKFAGHGIGLANCKKIAEMHGGRIWVESEPGKGSIFIFTILKFKA